MKSAWRVTSEFSKNLLVLWGYATSSYSDVVLPLTPTSAKWDDAAKRADLKKMFADNGLLTRHKFNWGKLFSRLLLILLLILLLAVLCAALANGTNGRRGTFQGDGVEVCAPLGDDSNCMNSGAAGGVVPGKPAADGTGRDNEPGDDSADSPLNDDGAEPDNVSAVSGGSGKINGESVNSAEHGSEEAEEGAGVDRSFAPGSEDNGVADGGVTNGGADNAGVVGSEKPQKGVKRAAFEFSVVPERISRKTMALGKVYDGAFKVVPVANGSAEGIGYEVKNWRVNGNAEKESGTLFTYSLRQDKRCVIEADVFVDGVKQRVNPYRWNCIDEPVWMIARVDNSDGKYQVLCVNASNVDFGVTAWDDPVFKDAGLNDITRKFSRINKLNRSEDGKIVELSWSQEHMGEYIMELKATVETRPGYGREAKRTNVSSSFALLNGARTEGLVSGKIAMPGRQFTAALVKGLMVISGMAPLLQFLINTC